MPTYLLGPFLSICPKPWRDSLRLGIHWEPATAISGLLQALGGLVGLSYWYMHAMNMWVGNGVDSALAGKLGPPVAPQEIGSVALAVWATYPFTWLLGYVGVEGVVRAPAAFSGTCLGILPLFLLNKILLQPFCRSKRTPVRSEGLLSNAASLGGAVRDHVRFAKLQMLPDELCVRKEGAEEILEIHSCRRKEDWAPPRTVRYEDTYYRLEADSVGDAPRPFRYTLRRLPAGVPGRSVLLYSAPDAVIRRTDKHQSGIASPL